MNKEFKRMIKLAGLAEIKVNKPNPLNFLQNLQSKAKATEDPLEKLSLAIQCAERVLFIFEEEFPNDKRPRKAIEAAKAYLADPTEENKKAASVVYTDAASAASDASDAAAYAAYAAAYAAYAAYDYAYDAAIKAVKEYIK